MFWELANDFEKNFNSIHCDFMNTSKDKVNNAKHEVLTFFFVISHRRACRIRPGGSNPFDLLSNINIRSFNIWGLLKSSAKTDPSTTYLGKHVEHFCVKFQRGKSVPVWCSVQNIHCNRLLACRYAELWTLLWYDWSHHWCVLHLWVSTIVK